MCCSQGIQDTYDLKMFTMLGFFVLLTVDEMYVITSIHHLRSRDCILTRQAEEFEHRAAQGKSVSCAYRTNNLSNQVK